MFEVWLNPKILRNSISPVTALVDEVKIRFEPGGLRIQTVDAANVGAVSIDLLKDAFHSYETEGDVITVDISRIEEIIRKASGHGNILLTIDEESREVIIQSGGYKFEQSLLVPDSAREGRDPHELDTAGEVILDSEDFAEAIGIASMISDKMKFGIDESNEVFYMVAKGDQESMHVTLDREDLVAFTPAHAYGIYSINYLNDIRKAFPPNSEIKIGLGEELPLKLQYEIANGNGRVTYGLAPRVEQS